MTDRIAIWMAREKERQLAAPSLGFVGYAELTEPELRFACKIARAQETRWGFDRFSKLLILEGDAGPIAVNNTELFFDFLRWVVTRRLANAAHRRRRLAEKQA